MTCLVCGACFLFHNYNTRANAPMRWLRAGKILGTSAVVTDLSRNACKPNPSSACNFAAQSAAVEEYPRWSAFPCFLRLPSWLRDVLQFVLFVSVRRACLCFVRTYVGCLRFRFGLSVASSTTVRLIILLPWSWWRPAPVATTTTGGGAMPWPLSLLYCLPRAIMRS